MNSFGNVGLQENWNRRMVMLAFPIILANLAQPMLSLVDTLVAGHLPGPGIWVASRWAACCSISSSGALVSCAWQRRGSSPKAWGANDAV